MKYIIKMTTFLKFYSLRITTDDNLLVMEFLKKYSSDYMISWEYLANEQKQTHCHIYMETTYQSRQPLVKWIQRNIGKGNRCYSLKKSDYRPIKYLAYILKEDNYSSSLPDELLCQAAEYDAKVKEDIKQKQKAKRSVTNFQVISEHVAVKLRLKPQTYHDGSLAEELPIDYKDNDFFNEVTSDEIVWAIPSEYKHDFRKHLVLTVVRYYQSHELFIREFHLTALCQTLLLKFDTNYSYSLTEKIVQKL